MNKYSMCVVSKEYRWVEVEAESIAEAEDKVWMQIDSLLNRKPQDYDTELVVDSVEELKSDLKGEVK